MNTSTGRPPAAGSGVQMLRFRQSSPGMSTSGRSTRNWGAYGSFGAVGPYSSAGRTPSQGFTGCGGRIRFSPNGAAA